MKYDLKPFTKYFKEYTELRVQENRHFRIVLVKGDVTVNERSSAGGVSARVYANGAWGFASHPEVREENIQQVVEAASGNASFLAGRVRKEPRKLPVLACNTENDFSTAKPRKTQKELVAFARELDGYLVSTYPGLVSRTVVLTGLDMEKSLVTFAGSAAYSLIPRTVLYISLSAEKDGQPVELMDVYGNLGHFEDAFGTPADLFERIDRQHEHLMKKREGVFPRAGTGPCVLDAELAGILAHEAIGHTTEADLVLGGSVAADFLGQPVASPAVTLVDYAHTARGKTCPVPVYCDDEGTPAEDAVLIDQGILKGYLLNKETAAHFNRRPTGNARAYQFSDEPLIRMRNTALVPGADRLEDMISSVDDGYYLIRPSNGQADSTSEFMFGITLGYEIKKGKLGRALKDTTISGVAFDMLKTVTMVSRDMVWSNAGMCGKKQSIPVGLGGPAIACRVNVGGR